MAHTQVSHVTLTDLKESALHWQPHVAASVVWRLSRYARLFSRNTGLFYDSKRQWSRALTHEGTHTRLFFSVTKGVCAMTPLESQDARISTHISNVCSAEHTLGPHLTLWGHSVSPLMYVLRNTCSHKAQYVTQIRDTCCVSKYGRGGNPGVRRARGSP